MFRRVFLSLMAGVTFVAYSAQANELPDTCDVEMYDLIKDVSWKHAQREVEMAQRIILKPDSVMEYVCLQSETGKVLGAASIAGEPMFQFGAANFGSEIGANTYDSSKDIYPKDPPSTCYTMDLVWHFLKCQDFGLNESSDEFFPTFEQLVDFDPRQYPQACYGDSPDDASLRNNKWDEAVENTKYDNVLAD